VRSRTSSGRIELTKDEDLEGPPILKPMKECPTPPKARELLSGINIMVPKDEGLISINTNPADS
jgi:hypothetical protein